MLLFEELLNQGPRAQLKNEVRGILSSVGFRIMFLKVRSSLGILEEKQPEKDKIPSGFLTNHERSWSWNAKISQGSIAPNLTDLCLRVIIFLVTNMTCHSLHLVCWHVCLHVNVMPSCGESTTVLRCFWVTMCICMYSFLS